MGKAFLKGLEPGEMETWGGDTGGVGGWHCPSPISRKAESWWAVGGHRDHTQNILAWADRVVGSQESLVALI